MIKINFVDFWPGFRKTDNYFFHLLNTKYNVVIDEDNPDILFFSVDYARRRERDRYKNKKCKRVFFTGENVRPNFDSDDSIEYKNYSIGKSDIAFTFDYSDDKRNYRFPLWAFYTNWFNSVYIPDRDPAYLVDTECFKQRSIIGNKNLFCNFLFSNPSGERINILNLVQKYKPVHCPGRLMNNCKPIGGRGDQIEKINFISRFKFTIAAENSQYDGYTTEKMIHPLSVGSIPIYWGSNRVTEEFNEKAFINANKLSGYDLLKNIIEIDQNDNLYHDIISQPIFRNNQIPEYVLPENVLEYIERSIL